MEAEANLENVLDNMEVELNDQAEQESQKRPSEGSSKKTSTYHVALQTEASYKKVFQVVDRFTVPGQYIVNWLTSGISKDLRSQMSETDLKKIGTAFCIHLVSAGILRSLGNEDGVKDSTFTPDETYYWATQEPLSLLPGKLNPTSDSVKRLEEEVTRLRAEVERLRKLVKTSEGRREARSTQTSPERYSGIINASSFSSPIKQIGKDESYSQSRCSEESGRFTASTLDLSPISVEKSSSAEESRFDAQIPSILLPISEVERQKNKAKNGLQGTNDAEDSISSLTGHMKNLKIYQDKCLNSITNDNIQDSKSIMNGDSRSDLNENKLCNNVKRNLNFDESGDSVRVESFKDEREPLKPDDKKFELSQNVECKTIMGIPQPSLTLPEISGTPPPPPPPIPGLVGPPSPPPPPMLGIGGQPPPPSMPETGGPPPPPPMSEIGGPPLPSPMPEMGRPPPPPMSGIGVPPPPSLPPEMVGLPPPSFLPGMGAPPPFGGPTPLPAPPMGGWNPPNRPVLRKEPLNPEIPMKPLYWTRILVPQVPVQQVSLESPDSPPEVPLWLEIEEEKNLNIKEFAELFSRQVAERKPTRRKEEMDKQSKIQPAKILDSKRSKMVGILEKSLHVDFSEVENAVYNLDTSVVNLEALQQIYEVRPTQKELEDIAKHETEHPKIPLDTPEMFLKRLSGIHHFTERIACLMFQMEFQDAISSVSSKLTNLRSLCEYMKSSSSLKKVMALILTLGNYMNGGNRMRGQADGFGLEILAKLKDVKSKVPGVTLLHYVVRARLAQEGDYNFDEPLPLPVPEPADVEAAATMNFEEICKELDRLHRELDGCQKKCKMVVETNLENEGPFKEKMDSFLNRAVTELTNEKEGLQEARNKFRTVMLFYQYVPKAATIETANPHDFFMPWLSFCQDFKDIWKKEQQRIKKEKIEQVRKKYIRKRNVEKVKKSETGLKARLQKLSGK